MSVSSKSKLPPRLKREVLAALLIADDYFTEKKNNTETENKLKSLTATIEASLNKENLIEP